MKLTYIYIATVLFGFIVKTVQAEAVKFNNHDEISQKINQIFDLQKGSKPVLTNLRFNYDMQIDLIKGKEICELLLQDQDAIYHYRSAAIEVSTKEGKYLRPKKVYLITHSAVSTNEHKEDSPYQAEFSINSNNIKISEKGSFKLIGTKIIDKTKFRLLEGEIYSGQDGFNTLFVDQISCEVEDKGWGLF